MCFSQHTLSGPLISFLTTFPHIKVTWIETASSRSYWRDIWGNQADIRCLIKTHEDQRDSKEVKELAVHVTNPGLIAGIVQGSPKCYLERDPCTEPRGNLEYCQGKQNKTVKTGIEIAQGACSHRSLLVGLRPPKWVLGSSSSQIHTRQAWYPLFYLFGHQMNVFFSSGLEYRSRIHSVPIPST